MAGTKTSPEAGADLGPIAAQFLASPNLIDQRKGRDLEELAALGRGAWKDRFQVLRCGSGPERSLIVVAAVLARGLVWEGNRPRPHDAFVLALIVPHTYPLSPVEVRFLDGGAAGAGVTVPFNPHVVHRDHPPDMTGLPPDLQAHLRDGHGACCYVRHSQWSADASNSLAAVVWQVSRVLTGLVFGEAHSLNPSARDVMLRMGAEGRLPLGPALPYPHAGSELPAAAEASAAAGGAEDADIQWQEE